MNKQELKFILRSGEGFQIEFKENVNGIDKEIVAFANSNGGRIFLGVSDNGKIKGVNITNKLKSQIQDIARNCDPSIDIKIEKFEDIFIVEVKEGKDKPYKCSSRFYLRQGANSQKMTRDEILDFAIGEGKIRFDEQINEKFKFPQDFHKEKLKKYLVKAKISKTISNKEILVNLNVAKKEGKNILFNNTGVMFFAKHPCKIIPQAYITCIRFKGIANVDIIDRFDFNDDIISNIDNAIKFVRRNTRLSYEIKDIQRKEIPEYPTEAIREAITNAVMHRDYFEKGANVFINIFDDRLEVYNPGGLLKGLSVKDFGRKCARRNPLIADLLHRVGYVEKAGTGIFRMKKAMKNRALPVPRIEITSFFTIIFKSNISEKGVEKFSKNQQIIIALISKNSKISKEQLKIKGELTKKAVEYNIEKLKQKKLLKRVGPAKGGHWEIIR